jgi:hypothetical protein
MLRDMRRLCLLSLFVLPLACQKSVTDEDTSNADESTDEESTNADESTDGGTTNADETTESTGTDTTGTDTTGTDTTEDTGDGDGDGDGDGECNPEGTLPGSCYCVEPGTEPCFQGCQPNTGMLTCNEVCAQIGETCIAHGCASGETTAHGGRDVCPGDSFLSDWTSQACDELIPDLEAWISCCCTLS